MSNGKWLIRTIGWVRWGVTFGLILFSIKIVANLTMTGVQKWIIDDIFLGGQYEHTVLYLSIFGISLIVYNAFHAIAARYIDSSSFQLFRLLTERLVLTLHRLPTSAIQGERTAKFVHHITGDVQAVVSVIQGFLPQGIQHGLSLILLGGFIGWASPLLLFAILAVSVVYIALARRFGPLVKNASKDVQDRQADLLVHIDEGISSSREVIAFHRLEWEERNFSHYFSRYFQAIMIEGKMGNKQMWMSDPLRWLVIFLTLGFGGVLVIQESMSIGMFVVVFQFAVQLMDAAQGMFTFTMQLSARMAAVERLRKVLEQETWHDGNRRLSAAISSLSLDGIHFRYGDSLPYVLSGVSVDLAIGRKIAFVGSSGGGKSTVAQLLIRFFEPTNGTILANGIPLREIRRKDWSDKVQIVFQEPFLFPDTIRTNLLMGRSGLTDEDLHHACKLSQIHSFIETFPYGYDTQIGERGVTLSGGQRQRLALARAMLGKAGSSHSGRGDKRFGSRNRTSASTGH
jgi:ABC-type bacteriocin/lantibiotic exporter with double-glycine peptidase domain